jgi:hypothetical protein
MLENHGFKSLNLLTDTLHPRVLPGKRYTRVTALIQQATNITRVNTHTLIRKMASIRSDIDSRSRPPAIRTTFSGRNAIRWLPNEKQSAMSTKETSLSYFQNLMSCTALQNRIRPLIGHDARPRSMRFDVKRICTLTGAGSSRAVKTGTSPFCDTWMVVR